VIAYITGSDRSCPKERIELFAEGSAAVVDDFRSVTLYRKGHRVVRRRLFQDKGFQGELDSFIQAIRLGEASPIPFREIFATTQATFKAVESLRKGQPVSLLEETP
jgi:polar amino acid transport system substrate-binding protein